MSLWGNGSIPRYNALAEAPSAAAYGVGPAWIGGVLYWSDGEKYTMATGKPFDPHGSSVHLPTTSASSRVALPADGATIQVRNYGPNRVFIKRGDATMTAAATDYPVEAFTVDYLYRDPATHTHLAAICENSGESASLSINCGEGGA